MNIKSKDGQLNSELPPQEKIPELPSESEGGAVFESLESHHTPEQLETDSEKLEKIRQEIAGENNNTQTSTETLTDEDKKELEKEIKNFKKDTKFKSPAILTGNRTATEYDSRVTNFSTRTKIVTLASGRKLFLINNYNTSWIHRGLDKLMKHLTGFKMSKAKSSEWKDRFISKSQIPVIPTEEENLIVLDYIPNINLYDLYANQDQIHDWGECDFAKNLDNDDLLDIIDKIMDKIKGLHAKDIPWGELILNNIIIDKDQNIHICDPEVSYDNGMPLSEQKARDLLDLMISSSAVMNKKHNTEHETLISRMIAQYEDEEVLSELKKLVQKKPNVINRLFFTHTKVRLGLSDYKQYIDIRETIKNSIE